MVSPKSSVTNGGSGNGDTNDNDNNNNDNDTNDSNNNDNKDKDKIEDKDNTQNGGTDTKDSSEAFAFIQLTDDEYNQLRQKCLESLNTTHGRTAFSLIINRQRNTEYGLELQKDQFFGLVELIILFFDSIQKSQPLDIKPAKLVMIMSQSLYVKKLSVMDLLTKEEKEEFTESKQDNNNPQKKGHHQQQSSSAFLKNNKLFIGDRIKNHAIWRNEKFWKEAYCDSVQQEILKYPAVKKWHSEQEQQEAERREEQIIFSQLAAWTHNMKEFGTDDQKILKFLDSRGLKAEQVAVLKMTLQLDEAAINAKKMKNNNNNNQKNDDQKDLALLSEDTTTDDNNKNNNKNLSTFETASGSLSPTGSTGLP